MWKIIIRLLKIPETPPKHKKLGLALWDLEKPRQNPRLGLCFFSLLSSQSFSSSLLFSSSLDTAPHSTIHRRCSPSQLPFCKILILAFSSLPQIQLPLLPPSFCLIPPENIQFPTINRIPAWQVQRFSKKRFRRKPQRGGRWSKRLVQDTHPIRKTPRLGKKSGADKIPRATILGKEK